MTAPSSLRGRLGAGESFAVAWLSLGVPSICEIAGRSGVAAQVLDLQHGLWERGALEAAVGLARPFGPVILRVEENGALPTGRALDTGADGVLVPLVDTAAEAAAAVEAARFPPLGRRSGGGVRPLSGGFGEYLASADGLAVGVMIETAVGIENAEAIAAVPGLDFVLVGTGDLGLSYEGEAERVEAGCARVLAACRAAGIAPGIFTPTAEAAAARLAEGYRMVVAANDVDTLRNGFIAAAARTR